MPLCVLRCTLLIGLQFYKIRLYEWGVRKIHIRRSDSYRVLPSSCCRHSVDKGNGPYSPGSILRPVLKRSASAGLIGMRSPSEELSDMNDLSSDIEP